MRAFCDIYNKNVNYAQFNKYVAFDESHDSVSFSIDYNVLNTKLIHLIISPFFDLPIPCSDCSLFQMCFESLLPLANHSKISE